jgi:hypothetical protein
MLLQNSITWMETELLGFWNMSIVRNSKYKKRKFRKLDLGEAHTLLGLLEAANLSHWT